MQKALKNLKKDISIQQLKLMQSKLEDSLDKKQRRLPLMNETVTSHKTTLPKINLNLSYEKTKHNLDEVFNYRSRSAQDTNKAHHESFSRPTVSVFLIIGNPGTLQRISRTSRSVSKRG